LAVLVGDVAHALVIVGQRSVVPVAASIAALCCNHAVIGAHVATGLLKGTRGQIVGEALLRGDRKQCCNEKVND
jgi:hypothetical protein